MTTNSTELAERLRAFRHHGIRALRTPGLWAYDIADLGFNYRLTDLQAALGISQLRRLDHFVARRNEIARTYSGSRRVDDIVLPPAAPPGHRHAHHLFPVRVPKRAQVYDEMRARGVGVQVHYVPTYRLSAYARRGFVASDRPATEEAYGGLLSLPMFPALTDGAGDGGRRPAGRAAITDSSTRIGRRGRRAPLLRDRRGGRQP